jgi:two-component system response regulator FixJ
MHYPVYVVDDDPGTRNHLLLLCESEGISCQAFSSGGGFLDALESLKSGCLILDMRMPGLTGLDVQERMAAAGRTLPVIAMTGFGDVDTAVQSMRLGAVEFLEKPFGNEILLDAVAQAFAMLEAASRLDPTG